MAKHIAVLGSTSSHGGHMIEASGTRFVTDLGPVCLIGDNHYCPNCPTNDGNANTTPIVSGCSIHATELGKAIVIEGSVASCGAIITGNLTTRSQIV